MRPLTVDDLLTLAEYAARRSEFVAAHRQYCERYRRVHVGSRALLTFENRQTLWFRVQEMLRVMRLQEPALVRDELERCNRLLPPRHHLIAGLMLWHDGQLRIDETLAGLMLDARRLPARVTPCRPEDRALGYATWLEFALSVTNRARFTDLAVPASFELKLDGERYDSGPLPDEVRQSLIDDLMMSDREAA